MMALLLAAAAGASAQQYKWVDKNGRVQYGDTPPPGVKATAMRAPAGPSAPPAAPAASARKGPAAVADQEKQRQAQSQSPEDEAMKKQNCANARDQLRMLESGQRIMRLDAKGERYFLEEAQVQQEATQARQAIQQWCN